MLPHMSRSEREQSPAFQSLLRPMVQRARRRAAVQNQYLTLWNNWTQSGSGSGRPARTVMPEPVDEVAARLHARLDLIAEYRIRQEIRKAKEKRLLQAIDKYTEQFGVGIGETTENPQQPLLDMIHKSRDNWQQSGWDYTTAHSRGAIDSYALFPGTVMGHEFYFLAREHDVHSLNIFAKDQWSLLGVYPNYESGQQAMKGFELIREAEIDNDQKRVMELRIAGYTAIIGGGFGISTLGSGRTVVGLLEIAETLDQSSAHFLQGYTGEDQRTFLSSGIGGAGLATGLLSEDNEQEVGDFIADYGSTMWFGAKLLRTLGQSAGRRVFRNSADDLVSSARPGGGELPNGASIDASTRSTAGLNAPKVASNDILATPNRLQNKLAAWQRYKAEKGLTNYTSDQFARWSKQYDQFAVNRSTGAWRESISRRMGLGEPGGRYHTPVGDRIPDAVDGIILNEIKNGRMTFTPFIRKQISKDFYLQRRGYQPEWHFHDGASKRVLDQLETFGIPYHLH